MIESNGGNTGLSRDFQLALFGGPLLRREGEVIPLSPLQKLLIGLLGFHGPGGVPREEVLSLFWRSGRESSLRKRLNQIVYGLRHRMGGGIDLIFEQDDRLCLDASRFRCDLEDFRIALGDPSPVRAMQFVCSGFLSGARKIPTSDLESWIERQDQEFRTSVRDLAARCWETAEASQDWLGALEASNALITLDPENPVAVRRRIQALGCVGRVAEARTAFQEFTSDRTRNPPGYEGGHSVDGFTERSQEGFGHLWMEDEPLLSREEGSGTPLVGRKVEIQEALTVLRQLVPGESARVAVSGPAGSGKTHLSGDIARFLWGDGTQVLCAAPTEFQREVPLSTLASALDRNWVKERVQRLPEVWQRGIYTFFPEWAPPSREEGPAGARGRRRRNPPLVSRSLCEAFRVLVEEISGDLPLVFWIDDFDRIDPSSLAVLDYVQQKGVKGRLGLLVGFRKESKLGAADSPPLRWILGGRSVVHLRIGELDSEDALELARGLLSRLDPSVTNPPSPSDLVAWGAGNPALLRVCVDHWAALSSLTFDQLDTLPALLLDSMARPILELPKPARRVLELISAAGKPLDRERLSRHLVSSDHPDGLGSLEMLVARGLVVEGSRRIGPANGVLAQICIGLMPEARRCELFDLYLYGLFDLARDPALQARFAQGARAPSLAAKALAEAAERAWNLGSADEAIAYLQRRVLLAREGPERRLALKAVAEGLRRAGRLDEAIETVNRMREDSQTAEQRLDDRITLLRLQLERDSWISPTVLQLRKVLEEAQLREMQPAELDVLHTLGGLLVERGDARELARIIERARYLLSQPSEGDSRALLELIVSFEADIGSPGEGLAAARRAIELASTSPSTEFRGSAVFRALRILEVLGQRDTEEGRSLQGELIHLAADSRCPELRALPEVDRGLWWIRCRGWTEGVDALQGVMAQGYPALGQPVRRRAALTMALARIRMGEPEAAISLLEQVRWDGRDGGSDWEWSALFGWANLSAARVGKATAIADSLQEVGHPPMAQLWVLQSFRARLQARLQQLEAADECFRTGVEECTESSPLGALELIIQRLEILGPKLGLTGWRKDVEWAQVFCLDRNLVALGGALERARLRLRPG